MLRAILESVDRLSKLINDVLDLTTATSAASRSSANASTSPACAEPPLETGRARAAEKSQKLEAEISPAAGYVFGDARRLRESVEHVLAQRRRLHRPEGADSCSRPTATMRRP